jgi:hypothetical protein
LRERIRLFEAHAAVTERTSPAREQRVGRRVVEVHVERIREEKLHVAERIPRAGTLAEEQLFQLVLVAPVHGLRIDALRPAFRLPKDLETPAPSRLPIRPLKRGVLRAPSGSPTTTFMSRTARPFSRTAR